MSADFLKNILRIALFILFIPSVSFAQNQDETQGQNLNREIVIFHTSDIHGYLLPHPARWHQENPKRMIGGAAAFSALLAKESRTKLILDSGDFFQGAPEGTISKGEAVIDLMNAIQYDAGVIGNHEYDLGEDQLKALIKRAKFPLLASNIFEKKTKALVSYATPFAIFEKDGIRIGVVGLATRFTKTSTLPSNVSHLDFANEVKTAKPIIQKMRKEGVDFIIALTHCGLAHSVARKRVDASTYVPSSEDLKYPGDLLIAQESGADLVLGGHTHTALSALWKPKNGAWIGQSGEHWEGTMKIVVKFIPQTKDTQKLKGNRSKYRFELESKREELWIDEVGEEAKIKAILSEKVKEIEVKTKAVIGETKYALSRTSSAPNLDGTLHNLVCDEMQKLSKADFALQNSFGLRADLSAGPITLGNLYEIMPFENTLVVMQLTGAQIHDLLTQNIKGKTAKLQVSKQLQINVPQGENAKIEILLNGKSLDLKHSYRVAMNSYMASGGSCCEKIAKEKQEDLGISLRMLMLESFKKIEQEPKLGRILMK